MIIYLFLNDHRWIHGHDSRHDHLFIYIHIFLYDHFGSVPRVKSWPQKQTTHVEKGGGRGWGFYSRQMPAGGGGGESAHKFCTRGPFLQNFRSVPPPSPPTMKSLQNFSPCSYSSMQKEGGHSVQMILEDFEFYITVHIRKLLEKWFVNNQADKRFKKYQITVKFRTKGNIMRNALC